MLWQMAYTELVFLPVHWPEFDAAPSGDSDRRVPAARAALWGVWWLSAIRRFGCASSRHLVLLPIALVVVVLGGWTFAGFVALMVGLMAWEWAGLCGRRYGRPSGRVAGGAALVVGLSAILLIASGQRGGGAPLPGRRCAARRTGRLGGRRSAGLDQCSASAISVFRRWRLIWLRAMPDLGFAWLLVAVDRGRDNRYRCLLHGSRAWWAAPRAGDQPGQDLVRALRRRARRGARRRRHGLAASAPSDCSRPRAWALCCR